MAAAVLIIFMVGWAMIPTVDNSSDVIYDAHDDITGIDTVRSLVTWQLDGDSGDYYDENTDLENLTDRRILNGTGNSK